MRKNFKRTLASLLVIVMLICAVPMGGLTASATDRYFVKFTVCLTDSWFNAAGCSWFRVYYRNNGNVEYTQFDQPVGLWNGEDGKICEIRDIFSGWIDGYPLKIVQYAYMKGELIRSVKYRDGTLYVGKDTNPTGIAFSGISYSRESGFREDREYLDVIASDGSIPDDTKKTYPDGYNFATDRYGFSNITEKISEKYYTTMYGKIKGKEVYNKKERDLGSHGHCYGMSLTTAATLINCPYVADYVNWKGESYNRLVNVNKGTQNLDMFMSAKDYIKYGFTYQYSSSASSEENANRDDLNGLRNAVYNYVYNNGAPVIVGFTRRTSASPGGHEVFAIGIDGNDILINDSNEPSKIKRLTLNDNEWTYSGGGWTWNNNISHIDYSTDTLSPYLALCYGVSVTSKQAREQQTEDDEINGYRETYSEEMDIVDKDKALVIDSYDSYVFEQIDSMIQLAEPKGGDESSNNGTLYWLTEGNTINATNTGETASTVKLAGNELKISATLPKDSSVEISVDENDENSIDINNAGNKAVEVTFSTATNDSYLDLTVSGLADEVVTATQTETGIVVTGLSDGTVTLTKDDEVIGTQEIKDAVSDIEITYDKDGTTGDMDVDYETDKSTSHCNCICHKTGFLGFIYKIVRIFWKIFKTNKTCTCGAQHY